jgi:hypothetical protein
MQNGIKYVYVRKMEGKETENGSKYKLVAQACRLNTSSE